MANRLSDQTAVVTGGGTGIGWAIAQALAGEGCRVVIAGRREATLREAIKQVEGPADRPSMITCYPADVANRSSVAQLFRFAHEQLGSVRILVNAAGINIANRSMRAMRPEQWDEVLAVNATGVYNCMHAVLPAMRQQGDGLILNISSIAGRRASELGGVAYCASKFAATALGTCVGNEVAGEGIRVTNILPGEVNTPLIDQRAAPVSDDRKAAMVQPEDFAELVVAIACLPPRTHIPEMVIKPTVQEFA